MNLTRITGNLDNGKRIVITKDYKKNNQDFEVYVIVYKHQNKIRIQIQEVDIELDKKYGMLEADESLLRNELRDFDTIEETISYILKTTILTEQDFPNKFKVKKMTKE